MCDSRITRRYSGVDEKGEGRSEVYAQISSDEVIISANEKGWNVRFDKEPTKVSHLNKTLSYIL